MGLEGNEIELLINQVGSTIEFNIEFMENNSPLYNSILMIEGLLLKLIMFRESSSY